MNRQNVNNRFAADIASNETLLPSEKEALIDMWHATQSDIDLLEAAKRLSRGSTHTPYFKD